MILWDGGNNDTPFYRPDLHITLVDPHRPATSCSYYPGETNLRMADLLIVNKVDTADPVKVEQVLDNCRTAQPRREAHPVPLGDHPRRSPSWCAASGRW